MAEYNRLQNSFITGYLDPLLHGLFNTEAYSTGLKECLNFIPSDRGYLYRRPGTRFVDFQIPETAKKNRIFTINSADGPLVFIISEGRIDFFSSNTQRSLTIENGGQYLSTPHEKRHDIPWKEEDLVDLNIYEFEGALYIVHPSYPPHIVKVLGQGSFSFTYETVGQSDAVIPEDPAVSYVSISECYVANAFYCEKIKFNENGIETFDRIGHYPSCQTFKGGRWYLSGCSSSPATIYASRSPDIINGDYRFFDFSVGDYSLHHLKVSMSKTTIFTTNEEEFDIESVSYSSETTTDEEIKVDGIKTEIPENVSTTTYSRFKANDESAGTWTGEDGATSADKQLTKKLVVTTTSDTWTLKSNLQNDDAIELTETDMYGSSVNWLITQQRVIAGTSRSIWMDDGSAATPTSFDLVKTLGVSTSKIQPQMYSSMIIFVPADLKSVKAFYYDNDSDGYKLIDMSATARSLFRNTKIKDIALVDGVETILWVLLENGKLLSCTLSSTFGWAEHELGGEGRVESLSAFHRSDDIGEVFLAVERKGRVTVERLVLEDIVNTNVFTLCDCMVPLTLGDNDTVDLQNISQNAKPYLKDDIVQVVAGGWAREPFEFDENITYLGPGHKAGLYMGYPYTSYCEMLWQELPVEAGQTSLSFKRKAISMALLVYRSAGAECGWISGIKEHLDPFQRLAKTNEIEPDYASYYSGIVKLSVPSLSSDTVNAVVKCSYPLPLTIQAIETRFALQEV